MGDRANIVVIDTNEGEELGGVVLYTHWSGTELPTTLKTALVRGRERWNDAPYLTRIIFDEMTGGSKGLTGFGISSMICDNEHTILVVDVARQVVVKAQEGGSTRDLMERARKAKGTAFEKYASG